jgi:hypothetical protein
MSQLPAPTSEEQAAREESGARVARALAVLRGEDSVSASPAVSNDEPTAARSSTRKQTPAQRGQKAVWLSAETHRIATTAARTMGSSLQEYLARLVAGASPARSASPTQPATVSEPAERGRPVPRSTSLAAERGAPSTSDERDDDVAAEPSSIDATINLEDLLEDPVLFGSRSSQ